MVYVFVLAYLKSFRLKMEKNKLMLYVMFYVIMTSGPMVQHSMVGPG